MRRKILPLFGNCDYIQQRPGCLNWAVPRYIKGYYTGENSGAIVPVFKNYVDNVLEATIDKVQIIHIQCNIHGIAIGYKSSDLYSAFVIISYNGDAVLVWKANNVWYEKDLTT